MKKDEQKILRDQVYYVDLGQSMVKGMQCGKRPCLVVSNDTGNKHSPTIHIIPFTTSTTKNELPTHYKLIREYENLPREENLLLCEQVQLVSKTQVLEHIATLEKSDMFQINIKILVVFFGLQYKPIIMNLLNLVEKWRMR